MHLNVSYPVSLRVYSSELYHYLVCRSKMFLPSFLNPPANILRSGSLSVPVELCSQSIKRTANLLRHHIVSSMSS
jgi:hypothetical protein